MSGLVVWTSSFDYTAPFNTKKFNCPTILLAGDTHHWKYPINYLLTYWAAEGFDYVATAYNRQHLHWFAAAGAENLAWLPLVSMRTVTHDWMETRESQVVFIGRQGSQHPRRFRLVKALTEAHLPLLIKTANREEAARCFASSLISLNCSQNGDLNLRNLEVISAGGFLLTDRLSLASGQEELLVPGTYCDVYDSEAELLEKVRHYLDHPQAAIEIARQAYQKFDSDWHPRHRIANLLQWVFGGQLPEPYRYSPQNEVRYFTSTSHAHLIDTRLAIYEPIQELHRVQERLRVLVSGSCPGVIVADLLDLPRLELYVEEGFADPCCLLQQKGVASRVHQLKPDPVEWPCFDAVVATEGDLERFGHPLKGDFAFVLAEDHQLLFSNADKLMAAVTFHDLSIGSTQLNLRVYEDTQFYQRVYLNFPKLAFPASTVVDIGAGVGLASAHFCSFHPEAVIHCFETDPLSLHLLQQNALALGNCHVHPVGLAGQDSQRTRRLWPEEPETPWGIEQVLAFRNAVTVFQELGLGSVDVLRLATGGDELEVLVSLGDRLKDIKVIYVEFYSEKDRKQIDQLLDPSHVLWCGEIVEGHRGALCYMSRDYPLKK